MDITPTIEAENTGADSPSIVESTLQRSSAAAAADNVLANSLMFPFESHGHLCRSSFGSGKWRKAIPSTSQMMKSPDVDMKG